MAEVDTSTYPRAAPPQQQNPLDQVGKLQEMGLRQQQSQKNAIGIDQEKLRLVNQKWDMNSKVLGELSEKGRTQHLGSNDLQDAYRQMVEYGGKTPEQFAQSMSSVPTFRELKDKNPGATPDQLNGIMHEYISGRVRAEQIKGASIMDAINTVHGVPGRVDNGQTQQSVVSSPFFGTKPLGSTFQNQIPPGTPTATPGGMQALGPQPQIPPQGGSATSLPTSSFVNSRTNSVGQPNNLTGPATAPIPRGPMLSQPPAFEEGKKQYAEDINQASQTLQAIKPAQQALKLMDPEVIKGLTGTGPIAEKATKILSALQGVGILNTSEPVAARQELTKKLAQYVGNNPIGQRSDAAQTLKEAGSPNPNVQVLPALINLTRDAIALDRVNAAKSLAFDDKDFSKYLQHKGGFANSIDERAFKLDVMPPDEREKLREQIKKESKSNQEKFLRSYGLAKKLNMFGE